MNPLPFRVHALPVAALSLATAIAAALPLSAQAGSFQLPTVNAAGWARAQAGGSLFPNDPTAAYNNPAAMAFFNTTVMQVSVAAIRPSAQFRGEFRDQQGNPVSGGNPNGFAKFKAFPNLALVAPVSDRISLGASVSVPYGLASEYSPDWQGRYFGSKTMVQSIAVSFSASFKVNDEFSMGLGILGQHTKAQLNTMLDPYGSADELLGAPLFPPQGADVQLNVNAKRKFSFGYFGGFVFKPTQSDTFGLSYHSRVRNKLSGTYRLYGSPAGLALLQQAPIVAAQLGVAGVPALNPAGGDASARLDMPAFASFDWTHAFNDRFTLGATAMWTGWSSFQNLALYSSGQLLVALPQKYKDSWVYSLGGDYKLNEAWTLRAGLGYDQSPSNIISRDPRIPDGSRRLVGLGVGYQASEHFGFDLGYQHQFVSDTPVRQTNPLALGAGSMNGKFKDHGDVVSLSGTYRF
jgi:long-chain fatty acid transport protein